MERFRQQISMCKISEVTVNDLDKINDLENQLNLNITKLNFFDHIISNKNFRFVKLISNKQIIGILQFSWNKSECDIISIGIIEKFQKLNYGRKLVEYLKSFNFKNENNIW